ncbi:sigma-70 family RNA polymerase sigma factor [Verrucomicrobiaceae bacterium N1E253]|uniref:Sigma-70 family RNA polymerase sigma factor n=1 Tax=Oceaniferula marina TaxID=2748318 RepID=A0A851GKG6_9BACT|nr:sigma-70 family RNA polymerase sigma factor [Oceaniferula marina]NWK55587.1 sigma-70 family RNA polymerase sigma factor [Oceaniferula marina]
MHVIDDARHPDPEPFVRLLAEHERYLGGYIYHLIPHAADAEDVLQDVKLALWQAFDQYEEGTNFGAWSRKVAFHRVMAFRKKKAVEGRRLVFTDQCIEFLAEQFKTDPHVADEEAHRLRACMARLKKDQQTLIALRYREEFSIEEIAVRMNKTVAASYRALSRVRLLLRKCLSKEGI